MVKFFRPANIHSIFLFPVGVLPGPNWKRLPSLPHWSRIDYSSYKPERGMSHLVLKMFQQLHMSLCIYSCKKILYPRSTISAMVCRDSHVKYVVFIEQVNKQLLPPRDCHIIFARLLP